MPNISELASTLPKNSFQVHALESEDCSATKRKLSRSGIVKFLAEVEPCARTLNGFRPTHPTLPKGPDLPDRALPKPDLVRYRHIPTRVVTILIRRFPSANIPRAAASRRYASQAHGGVSEPSPPLGIGGADQAEAVAVF